MHCHVESVFGGHELAPPDSSVESNLLCSKSRLETDLSFFICIIRKLRPSNEAAPHGPPLPGEGMHPPEAVAWRSNYGSHSGWLSLGNEI